MDWQQAGRNFSPAKGPSIVKPPSDSRNATNSVRRRLEAKGFKVDARKPIEAPLSKKNIRETDDKRRVKAVAATVATSSSLGVELLQSQKLQPPQPQLVPVQPPKQLQREPPATKVSTTTDGKPILLSLPTSTLSTLLPPSIMAQKFRITQYGQELQDGYEIGKPDSITETLSSDGTRKCLLSFGESVSGTGKPCVAAKVECVYIPNVVEKESTDSDSQVGCSLACTFCHTGTQKMLRNLEPWEMVAQVMHGLKIAGDFGRDKDEAKTLTNIVLMGQGEPLHNYKALYPFMKTLTQDLGFHPSKITLSTSGIAPLIPQIASDLECSLAISLHATNDTLRTHLDVLMDSIRQYILLHGRNKSIGKRHKRVTFEYVMLNQVNDSLREAEELVALLKKGLKVNDMRELASLVHVNLIPFHSWEGSGYVCSPMDVIEAFRKKVVEGGINCHVRVSRGVDVLGACGQLRSMDLLKQRRSHLIST
ncbi:hypothetical protein BDR26DRAFT_861312 [Obelidium mucronatum]|nr:hypothetical protein BDR26DRAFT_861312 [Obelidium mucronatum]